MLCVIRTAALDDAAGQRVRLAASLLGAFRLRAHIAEWDGSRCHLLIASALERAGRMAMAHAVERRIPVLAIGEAAGLAGVIAVDAETSAQALARHILGRVRDAAAPSGAEAAAADLQPALCRLALPPLRGKSVVACRNGRTVYLQPQTGRVHAASHSDLIAARETLAAADWNLTVAPPPSHVGMVSASLESFLAEAACGAAAQLPPFPGGRYQLDAWPDLGAAPNLVGALRVTWKLVGKAQNPAELVAGIDGLDREEIDACLWSFAAADLLRESATGDIGMRHTARMEQGVWTRLARRFGLLRS